MENKNQESEVDLISLFEYIKSNIKSLFKGLFNLLKGLFNLILDFLGVAVKWKYLILGVGILGVGSKYLLKEVLGDQYTYEWTVQANYNCQTELYSQLERFNELNSNRYSVEVEAVKSEKSIISNYFNIARAAHSDTVFFNNYNLREFGKALDDKDFIWQKVVFYSSEVTDFQPYIDSIRTNIESINAFEEIRNAKVNSITRELESIQAELAKIDTILQAQAKKKIVGQSVNDIILNREQSKDHLEAKLLEASADRIARIKELQIELPQTKNILETVSGPTLVENKRISGMGLPSFMGYGLLIGFILVILIEAYRFLVRRNKAKA